MFVQLSASNNRPFVLPPAAHTFQGLQPRALPAPAAPGLRLTASL